MGVSAIAKTNMVGQTTGFKKGVRIKIHRLAEKDTLYSLEKQYGLPVGSLAEFNNIKKEKVTQLPTGMAIRIPLSGVSTKRNTPPKPVARPASQTAAPAKKFSRPASQTAAPAKKFARPASQTATPVKKAARPVSQVVTQAAGTKAPAASKAAEQKTKQSNPFSGSYDDFKSELAARESTSRTNVMNKAGYAGKYQIGKAGMEEVGVYKRAKDEKQNKNYTGTFTGEFGVTNITSFLSSPIAQEKTMDALQKAQWRQIQRRNLEKYSGTNISYVVGNSTNSVLVTDSGMLAGAHLVGSGNLAKFLRSGGKTIPKDGNGTPVTEYMKNFGNYDVRSITTNSTVSASASVTNAVKAAETTKQDKKTNKK